jgi:hypothetical protein
MAADLAVHMGWGDVLIVIALCIIVVLALGRIR